MPNLYATLNQVKDSSFLNIPATTTTYDSDLLTIIEETSRQIDRDTDRFFYTYEGTFYQDGGAIRVILDWDVQSITTLDCDTDGDGVYESSYNLTTTSPDAFLYPLNETPKTRLEANPWGRFGHFGSGIRKAIKIVGVFGYGNDWPTSYFVSSGVSISASTAPTAFTSTMTTMTVSTDASGFSVGHTIRIANGTTSEQMYVTYVTTASMIVTRAVNGTIAGPATTGDVVYVAQYPQQITKATLISTMRTWKRKDSAFQNAVGNPMLGTVTVWKGDDPDYSKIIIKYRKTRRGWYLY